MASKFQTFLVVTLIGSVWVGAFSTAGKFFSPVETPRSTRATDDVQTHFLALSEQQRKLLGFDAYYTDKAPSEQVTAVLDFTTVNAIPIRTPALDGFRTGHVDISRGNNGVRRVVASFFRPQPYVWPRTLDVILGPKESIRCDLDDEHSSPTVAKYIVESRWKLDMKSPNGHFAWYASKDDNVLNAEECLYRQDLYKDGEYYKSIAAVAQLKTSPLVDLNHAK